MKPKIKKFPDYPVWMCVRLVGPNKLVAVGSTAKAAYQAAHPAQLPPIPNGWPR
jgi:hypothetical protein